MSVLLLVGCSQEQDTRLVCDCDYERYSGISPIDECPSTSNNNSLVFNESKKKFIWNGVPISLSPDQFMEFNKDSISYWFDTKFEKIYISFDRTNLVYVKSIRKFNKIIGETRAFYPPRNTFYQCRVVDGV